MLRNRGCGRRIGLGTQSQSSLAEIERSVHLDGRACHDRVPGHQGSPRRPLNCCVRLCNVVVIIIPSYPPPLHAPGHTRCSAADSRNEPVRLPPAIAYPSTLACIWASAALLGDVCKLSSFPIPKDRRRHPDFHREAPVPSELSRVGISIVCPALCQTRRRTLELSHRVCCLCSRERNLSAVAGVSRLLARG